ncbi:hypothetical protein KKA15_04410 [Patescibacteria group bacterium]|nr:hypothetical protein [Patescibacteria group bacterium]
MTISFTQQELKKQIEFINKSISESVFEFAKKKFITRFEELAFYLILDTTKEIANAYIELCKYEPLPLIDIKDSADCFILLCADELYEFIRIVDYNKELKKLIDVSEKKFIQDFATCFDNQRQSEVYFLDRIQFYRKTEKDGIDPRDRWYSLGVLFIDKIYDNNLNFEEILNKNPSRQIELALVCQQTKLLTTKFLFKAFNINVTEI